MNRSSKAKNGMNVRQNMYKSSAEQVVNGDRLSSRPRGYSDEKTDHFRMYVVYIKKKEKMYLNYWAQGMTQRQHSTYQRQ